MCIRDSEYREEKLEQLASAEERNRESFNPDVDLGPEPVTEKSAKISDVYKRQESRHFRVLTVLLPC